MPEKRVLPSESIDFRYDVKEGLVSIVIVCYNDLDLLRDLIPDIQSQTHDSIEVICVLNGDDHSSRMFLSEHDVRIIDPDENLWYSGGNDCGVEAARGEYLFILNPDTRLETYTIERLVEAADSIPQGSVFVPKVLSQSGRRIDSVGKFFSKSGWFARIGAGEFDKGQYDKHSIVPAFDGAAFLIRRSVIKSIGLFDRQFEHYQETNDLSIRVFRNGGDIITVPDSIVYHKGGGSFSEEHERSTITHYYAPRNDLLTISKNYNLLYMILVLPIHIIWPLRAAFSLMVAGDYDKAMAKIRGLISGIQISIGHITNGMSLPDQVSLFMDYPKDLESGSELQLPDSE